MAKQSPLRALHEQNGAVFAVEEGWDLPLRFGDPLEEYSAVRSQVGMLDLCHRALLRFTGPDRVSYLQGMVSNDVKRLAPGEGAHAAVLEIQGKILADLRIFCTEDSFLLDLWEFLKERTLAHLHRYLIADEVEIADLTGQYGVVSLQGPKAERLLGDLFPELPARELDHRLLAVGDAEVRIARSSHTGEEGYDLFLAVKDMDPVMTRIREKGKTFSLRWIGAEAQETLRLEAGIPRYGVDMSEDTLLLETGLERAVSFTKGCYLGQEVVERIRSRGHVNKKLAGLLLAGGIGAEPGDPVRSGEREIGRVTSAVFSPTFKRSIALGYLHRDYLRPGTRTEIDHKGTIIPAEVSSLPFVKR